MRRAIAAAAVGLLICTAALVAAAAASAATWVSYPVVLREVRSGPLIRVILNPARSDIEIKFTNKDEWHAYYPAGARSSLQRLVDARHIRLIFVPRPRRAAAPGVVHHRLRYVAAGVLAACVLAGAVAYLLRRRRRGVPSSESGAPET